MKILTKFLWVSKSKSWQWLMLICILCKQEQGQVGYSSNITWSTKCKHSKTKLPHCDALFDMKITIVQWTVPHCDALFDMRITIVQWTVRSVLLLLSNHCFMKLTNYWRYWTLGMLITHSFSWFIGIFKH